MTLLALALALLAQGEALRLGAARVALEGPLEELTASVLPGAPTRAVGPLAAGERRELLVPMVLPPGPPPEPELAVRGGGSARFLEWTDAPSQAQWERLPVGLRARPRPPLVAGEPARRPPPSAVLAALGALVAGLGLRRRPVACAAASTLLAAAVLALALRAPAPAPRLRLLEGDLDTGRWLQVDVARDAVELDGIPARVEVEPALRRAELALDLERPGRWTLRAPGALLRVLDAYAPQGRSLAAERNAWASFAQAWVRDASGAWRSHGPWPLGAPLPPPREGRGEPPGWLNPALPMGTPVLVGELASPGSEAALEPRAVWLRATGRALAPGD